jgi:Barstar (barnase inhibitor)
VDESKCESRAPSGGPTGGLPGGPAKPALEHLSRPTPPWVELVVLTLGHVLVDIGAVLPGFAVRRLDGGQCVTKDALLRTIARTLPLPAHFGVNWDALEDSLTDLEWLPAAGYVLVITEADRLLAGSAADYRTFVAILENVGAEWGRPRSGVVSRPPRPFHTLMTVSAAQVGARREWLVPVRHGLEAARPPASGQGTSTTLP